MMGSPKAIKAALEAAGVFNEDRFNPALTATPRAILKAVMPIIRQETAQEIADDIRGYPGLEIEGDPLRSHYLDADIVADYIEQEYA
jgi:hypothetical protein